MWLCQEHVVCSFFLFEISSYHFFLAFSTAPDPEQASRLYDRFKEPLE